VQALAATWHPRSSLKAVEGIGGFVACGHRRSAPPPGDWGRIWPGGKRIGGGVASGEGISGAGHRRAPAGCPKLGIMARRGEWLAKAAAESCVAVATGIIERSGCEEQQVLVGREAH